MSAGEPSGCLYGIGTGPGCPELMTLKAVRVIGECSIVAHFCKEGRPGNALKTATPYIREDHEVMAMAYPVTTELPVSSPEYARQIESFFDDCARDLATYLDSGRSVAVLSEGDPFFYGSFMHVFLRLRDRFPTCVVPGVPAALAGAAQLPFPLTMRDDVLSVIPGTLPNRAMESALAAGQAAVIMKVGQNLPRIRQALRTVGMEERAWYVERASMDAERVMPLADAPEDSAPYFSLILVPGRGERV